MLFCRGHSTRLNRPVKSFVVNYSTDGIIDWNLIEFEKFSSKILGSVAQLTEEHKRRRMEICQTLLNRYNNEGEAFLSRIVTGDESWVHHYSPETKRQSLEWKHPSSPVKKKFKSQLSAGKVMLTIFWDSKGPIIGFWTLQKGVSNCDLVNYS